jgi:hypothetical protein
VLQAFRKAKCQSSRSRRKAIFDATAMGDVGYIPTSGKVQHQPDLGNHWLQFIVSDLRLRQSSGDSLPAGKPVGSPHAFSMEIWWSWSNRTN